MPHAGNNTSKYYMENIFQYTTNKVHKKQLPVIFHPGPPSPRNPLLPTSYMKVMVPCFATTF